MLEDEAVGGQDVLENARGDGDAERLGLNRRPPRRGKFARSVYSGPILHELRSAIVGGRFERGTRLVEERLAAEFGVSRGPIRSALRALESEGLVATRQRGGMVVSGFTREDLSSLFRVRYLLESSAIRWGIGAGADPRPVSSALAALGHEGAGLREDMAFHRAMVEFARSRFLFQAWDSLAPLLETAIEAAIETAIAEGGGAASGTVTESDRDRIFKAHAPIAEAIAAGDASRACELLERQFADAEASLRSHYEADPARPSQERIEGVSS